MRNVNIIVSIVIVAISSGCASSQRPVVVYVHQSNEENVTELVEQTTRRHILPCDSGDLSGRLRLMWSGNVVQIIDSTFEESHPFQRCVVRALESYRTGTTMRGMHTFQIIVYPDPPDFN